MTFKRWIAWVWVFVPTAVLFSFNVTLYYQTRKALPLIVWLIYGVISYFIFDKIIEKEVISHE